MEVLVATIAASAAFAAPVTAAIIQAGDKTAPATQESCINLTEKVAELARKYPKLARIYGEPGRSSLPPLASRDEMTSCGNPERTLEELARRGDIG